MSSLLLSPLRAFHQDPTLKAHYLARVQAHQRAGEVVRGRGPGAPADTPTGWCGSAVGCLVHAADAPYAATETQLGVPRLLAQVADLLFEGLSAGRSQTWASDFLEAIPVGADLAGVWPQLAGWLLLDADYGLLRGAQTDGLRQAIRDAAALYQRTLPGAGVTPDEWAATVAAAAAVAHEATTQAATAAQAYATLLAAEETAKETKATTQATEAAQKAAATAQAQAGAAARAAARAKALGLGTQAAASAAAKAAAGTATRAAAKAAVDWVVGFSAPSTFVEPSFIVRSEAASTAVTLAAEAAVAGAAYAALATADAQGHVVAAAYAQAAADAYTAAYALQAADTAYAQAFGAAVSFVSLYSFTALLACRQRATPIQDHLAAKLLALLAAAPTGRAPAN